MNLSKNKYSQFFIIASIIVLTIIIYSNSVNNGFVNWDDDKQIINNPDIKALSADNIIKFFSNYYLEMYQPLASFSYAVEYHFFGLAPESYHIDNLILHLLNIILVFFFIYTLTHKINLATIVALFFSIHPMNVEDVAWISARSSLMYTFFYLSGLISYLKYLAKSEERRAKSERLKVEAQSEVKGKSEKYKIPNFYYFFSLFLFILSLLSKSAAVSFPLVLLLIDYFKERRAKKISNFNFQLLEKLPFFIIAIIFGIIAIYSHKSIGGVADISPLFFSIFDRIFLVTYSISFYIIKLLIPAGLCVMYSYPIESSGMLPIEYYLSAVFITGIVISIILIKSRKTGHEQTGRNLSLLKKDLIFGLLFYLVSIMLVSQIIRLQRFSITSDRYVYITYIGLLFVIGKYYSDILEKVKSQKSKLYLFALRSSLFAFCVLFSVITYQRNKVWKDGITLFTDVIEKHPDVSLAYCGRGAAKNNTGDFKGALEDFNKAIALDPNYKDAYNDRGLLRTSTNDFKGAMEDLSKAIALNPDYEDAYRNRGGLRVKMNDFKGAIEDLNKAIVISPDDGTAYSNRGWIKTMLLDYKSAIEDLNKAISLKPEFAEAYNNRGWAKTSIEDFNGALEDFNKAIALNPTLELAYINRGRLKGNIKDYKGSMQDFNITISLNPTNDKGFYYRGCTKSNLFDYRSALEDLNKAIGLNPNFAMAFLARGNVYFKLKDMKSACDDWNSALKLGLKQAKNNISYYCRKQ